MVDTAGGEPGHPQQPGFVARDGAFCQAPPQDLNELLGTHIANPPSDSTFRLLLSQLDVDGFDALLQQWMAAQPGVTESVDTLATGGQTLRGSIDQTALAKRVLSPR